MSILIKGAELPKSCERCSLCYFQIKGTNGNKCFCEITHKAMTEHETWGGRHPDCPLVDIPPHGRLIDADETKRVFGEYFEKVKVSRRYAESLVDNAIPTVIESEE